MWKRVLVWKRATLSKVKSSHLGCPCCVTFFKLLMDAQRCAHGETVWGCHYFMQFVFNKGQISRLGNVFIPCNLIQQLVTAKRKFHLVFNSIQLNIIK